MEQFTKILTDLDANQREFWLKVRELESAIIDAAYQYEQIPDEDDIGIILQAQEAAADVLAFARNIALGMSMSSLVQKRHLDRAHRSLTCLIEIADEELLY